MEVNDVVRCEGCGYVLDPGVNVCPACGRVSEIVGQGEKTKLTINFGNKAKTLNLGTVGNLGVSIKTGDSSQVINVRKLGEATKKGAETITPGSGKKSKIIAIILAIFYGFPTWIYTYSKDKAKFWLFWLFIIAGAALAGVGANLKSNYVVTPGGRTLMAIGYSIDALTYFWPLVTVIRRPWSFYKDFGSH
jgi:hypothetical protein